MRRICLFAVSLFILLACNSNKNTVTQTESEDEWIALFDGETTKGWHTYGKETIGEAWKVEDGVLYLDASQKEGWQVVGGGDIVTEEEFDNFHFKMDWKISENGNSGIIFYVHEDFEQYNFPWQTGLEMQILDNDGHPDGKIHKHRASDLYDLIPCSEEVANPVGEWNTAEIVSKDGKLDFYLNGKKVVSTTLWNDEWKEMVANSKFASMPGFGTYKKGKIALQDHGDNVYFRNIMVKRL